MSFSNQNYIYDHLPSRYRREDKDLFLKRYLQFTGETLDEWDAAFDAFFGNIEAETAQATWIAFWLEQLFGWSWCPRWFTLADKRRLYGNFGRHLGRRGTRRGIELFLLDFGIVARVHTRALAWGEFVWGETAFSITSPLHLIVEIFYLKTPPADMSFLDESPWGEAVYTVPQPVFTDKEILDLVRFEQPYAQEITVAWRLAGKRESDVPVWEQIQW